MDIGLEGISKKGDALTSASSGLEGQGQQLGGPGEAAGGSGSTRPSPARAKPHRVGAVWVTERRHQPQDGGGVELGELQGGHCEGHRCLQRPRTPLRCLPVKRPIPLPQLICPTQQSQVS